MTVSVARGTIGGLAWLFGLALLVAGGAHTPSVTVGGVPGDGPRGATVTTIHPVAVAVAEDGSSAEEASGGDGALTTAKVPLVESVFHGSCARAADVLPRPRRPLILSAPPHGPPLSV